MSEEKSKKKKRPLKGKNADFRRRANFPAPAVEEIEKELVRMLTPAVFKPQKVEGKKLRERILTLPVMCAVVISMVWRVIPSLSELLRVLAKEGLLWVGKIEVSKQALSKRLDVLPAKLFAEIFAQAITALRKSRNNKDLPKDLQQFSEIWIADGSTLEELRKKLKEMKEKTVILAGKMMVVVEAYSHLPVMSIYDEKPQINDKCFCEEIIKKLPLKGLLIFDLGFFSFPFFDSFTKEGKFFLTRLRENTAFEVKNLLSSGTYYRDEIIKVGLYRSNPSEHNLRLVSVLWGKTWYRYLTNVLDPQMLSPKQVCDLYRRRWTIEDAFLLTKRLLGLSYLWSCSKNAVEIQIYSTWIFYSIINNLCIDVSKSLNLPLERISVEMVFRSLYHFSHARLKGDSTPLIDFLCNDAKLFGLVKQVRNRVRERDSINSLVWATP